jgi:eukaryotic-like serine/threonine-protein kinase
MIRRQDDLAVPLGNPIMNACPKDGILLQFLDGKLNADDDAWVLAHVEDCAGCQEHLERMTAGRPVAEERPPIETAQTDVGATVDLQSTEVVGRDAGPAGTGGDPQTVPMPDANPPSLHENTTQRPLNDATVALSAPGDRIPGPDQTPSHPRIRYFGDYEIVRELARGGMGVVFEARQMSLSRPVALKMILAGQLANETEVRRFYAEAEAAANLDHPGIVPIYEVGEHEGQHYFSMGFIEGQSLTQRLADGPVAPREAAELTVKVAEAIEYAHQRGVIHRDLKPANILLDRSGNPRVTDFGLAKKLKEDSGLTGSGQIMGTPSYMPPEQAGGNRGDIGPPADVYALGATLYALVTGRPPFQAATAMDTVLQVISDEPVPPRRLNPAIPCDLETICLKCLAKEQGKRYAGSAALAEDLQRYLAGEPIVARPVMAWEHAVKWARRRPAVAALLALAATAVLGGFLGALEFQRRSNQSYRRENDRIMALRADGTGRILLANDEMARNNLTNAEVTLTTLKEKVKAEAKLEDLTVAVQALLDEVRERQTEQSSREKDRTRYADFVRLRNEALFHDTQFAGLNLSGNQEATRRATQAALALFAVKGSGDSWALASLPTILSGRERGEVEEGSYELLLTLAEAEPRPAVGLLWLDQAARLRPATRAYHLRRAACLTRAGDMPAAERERKEAETLKPTTAFDHFLVGQERYKRGEFATAIQSFSSALRLRTDHFWAQCLWATSCMQLNQPSEARSGLNACILREPGFAWLYLLRGLASYQLAVRAGDLIDKLPSQVGVLRAEAEFQSDAAATDYRLAGEVLDEKPDDELRYALYVNHGLLGLERRDFENAAADLQAAIRLNERRLEGYAALAAVYQQQDKPDGAAEQYSRAIVLQPESAPLYRGRADVHLARKQSTPAQRAQALGDLDQAIRLEKPGNLVVARDQTNRGRLLALDHRDDEALTAWDAALAAVHDYPEAHRLRLDLLFKRKRYDAVIRSCDALITRGKATPQIYELRGLARTERNDFPGAIEDITNAMALRPDSATLLSRRGWLYIVSDAPKLALHDFEAAIQLDPSFADAYNGRGYARLRLGEHHDAVADAERALGKGEQTSQLIYNSARVYALAAVVAAAEVRKRGQGTVTLVGRYEDRATGLLREALKRMPEDRRALFWRDVVPSDPALRALRRRLSAVDGSADAQKSSLAPTRSGWPKAG